MFYVVPYGEALDVSGHPCFEEMGVAKVAASSRQQLTGTHHHIIKVEGVWTTKTPDQIMREWRAA